MDILKRISDCILNMDEESIGQLIKQAIESEHMQLQDIYEKGLNDGMVRAIEFFESKRYDIPEIIVCADTLNKGLKALEEYGSLNSESKGRILLAVVAGDTHEIGKNIAKIMLEAAGYDVIDFGVNKSVDEIIKAAEAEGAQVIGLSSMMTTTRGEMKKLIDRLGSMDSADKPYVIIGGGSVTQNYSVEINADGYASNAPNTVKLLQRLLKEGI